MAANNARRNALDSLEFTERFDATLAFIDDVEGFDAALGVETSGPVEPWEIREADDATLVHNSRYSPTPVRTIRQAISAAGRGNAAFRLADVSFVDFGSGKGRVLLVAAEFPFTRVVGVEFSSALCETARANIARLPEDSGRPAIDVRCQDAREFEIPGDAGFFYFYEPFSTDVAASVLDNIEESLARFPRTAVLCFVGSATLPVLDGRATWSQLGGTLTSPDDPYYATRLYTNTGGR
ncbi:SAM-dependent methyltransferase [Streptomyces sp. CB02959]|uniref:class I SAM-dependent methyltransferase n=1 Tax=Streptomyces sp. CB02959 TaxID=2020330 RepID=UPI000C275FBE|nr:class I SAM-dependent methyltransferase [Streptomyces sp. CB02959]PJN39595.1 SAM-dependent methyltransferase [Streptomyces sp. CB02959]